MKVAIKLDLSLGAAGKEDNYRVQLNLPSSAPTDAAPFEFGVQQYKIEAEKIEITDTLLQVAIGATGQVYVAVRPPQKLIKEAKVDQYVKSLEVLVEEGKQFNPQSHTFE